MNLTTAASAGLALFFAFSASTTLGNSFSPDEPNVEPEIINITAISLFPEQLSARRGLMPVPRQPALQGGASGPDGAHVLLGDIPFQVGDSATSLWERIRGGFALEDLPSPLVKEWENWYASRPDYMSRMISRGERYLFHVIEEVEKRRMPAEIALLPMIESAYNPTAYSRAHASGMWQFIPSTGKLYGLKQDWWQDERRDVLAATRAALDYLEKLYAMFGSWELALASYNWGEGAVGRAIQRNESRGLRGDYLSLDMPAETRNYLPKLMAVKNLIARPENFGLALAELPNRPYFAVVTTDRHIDVKLAAQFAEMPVDEFLALNPSHNRPVIRAETTQPILLPADRVARFQARIDRHNEPLVSWQSYTIGKQDSLDTIAARFGIPAPRLREVNGLSAKMRNLAGLTILVPAAGERPDNSNIAVAGFATPSAPETPAAQPPLKYVVKPGESLTALAQRFGVSVAELTTRNGIRNGRLLTGQTLMVDSANRSSQPAQTSAKAPARQSVQVAKSAPKAVQTRKAGTPTTKTKTQDTRVQVAYSAPGN